MRNTKLAMFVILIYQKIYRIIFDYAYRLVHHTIAIININYNIYVPTTSRIVVL